MANLIRMDLYRMRKAKGFWVCLILAFVFALCITPMGKLLEVIARLISDEVNVTSQIKPLAEIIGNPFPLLNAMLAMLSACAFFYADVENGYIKNIAGQMPKKGYTILSKFAAIALNNLLFMLVGVAGNLLGTVFLEKITAESGVMSSVGTFALKFLLMQSICAILLLVSSSLRNKSLGTVLAVLLGTGLLSLVYLGIDAGLAKLLPNIDFSISEYMPDQLLSASKPAALDSILSSAATIAVFLPLAIRIFDKKDVK